LFVIRTLPVLWQKADKENVCVDQTCLRQKTQSMTRAVYIKYFWFFAGNNSEDI
jgi:hypothetical protein